MIDHEKLGLSDVNIWSESIGNEMDTKQWGLEMAAE